jgi:hypothetical protein
MNLRANLNQVPNNFQVLSTHPQLKIRDKIHDSDPILLRILSFILAISSLYISVMFGRTILPGLLEIVTLHVWKGVNTIINDANNLAQEPLGVWGFFIALFTPIASGSLGIWVLWCIFGVTEFQANRDSLKISYKLLGLSYKVFSWKRDIKYFNQFSQGNDEDCTWILEIVTNRKCSNKTKYFQAWFSREQVAGNVTRLDYETINLYNHLEPSSIAWLGSVLADFYGISFRSSWQSNHVSIQK